jgi:RHS repeat-associated protein
VSFRRQVNGQWATTRSIYYPTGALAFRQNESEVAVNEGLWTRRDTSGRVIETTRAKAGADLKLTTLQWDGAPPLVAGCSSGIEPNEAQRKLKGRIGFSLDPVWNTWFAYDELGRLVTEHKVSRDTGAVSSCASGNGALVSATTKYSYRPNGGVDTIQLPHGRRVVYRYPSTGAEDNNLPSGVAVDFFLDGQRGLVDLITDVKWTPDERLERYRFRSLAGLSFQGETPVPVFGSEHVVAFSYGANLGGRPEACFREELGDDASGRLRRVLVKDAEGTPVYERTFTWSADQVTGVDVCYRGQEVPLDLVTLPGDGLTQQGKLLRNLSTGLPGDAFAPGVILEYASSGERLGERRGAAAWASTLTASGELMSLVPQQPVDTAGTKSYSWDADGRLAQRSSADTSKGVANSRVVTSFPLSELQASGGVESVLRTVELTGDDAFGPYGGVYYNYFYDAANKRTRKTYPNGASEDFFYDQSKRLVAERSFELLDGDSQVAIDDYLYLGGMPVGVVLGQLRKADGARENDLGSSCSRRNVMRRCGAYHFVSDYQGTPVISFDPNLSVSGVGEFDVFGHRNRRRVGSGETTHPQSGSQTIAHGIGVMPAGNLTTLVRLRVGFLDADGPDFPVLWSAQVAIREGGVTLSDAWGTLPNMVTAYHPGSDFEAAWETQGPNVVGKGAVVEAFEYERADRNVELYFPPLRFPGQYADEETGFYENWNRYLDPETGRYLSPEPLLQSPVYLRRMAQGGMSVPTYAYGLNNPLRYVDPTGLETEVLMSAPRGWGASSMGHVAVNVNGTVYSFARSPTGGSDMEIVPLGSYLSDNDATDIMGVQLLLSPSDEAGLERSLRDYGARYSWGPVNNNCVRAAGSSLAANGLYIIGSFTPQQFISDLLKHPAAVGTSYYPSYENQTRGNGPLRSKANPVWGQGIWDSVTIGWSR